jgi:hypothetical protein
MKFLWIFTLAISSFFAYHTYTHTRLRYKDLEMVQLQNDGLEKALKITHFSTEKQWRRITRETGLMGNPPKDIAILKQTDKIKEYADSLRQIIEKQRENWDTEKLTTKVAQTTQFIHQSNDFNHTFPVWVAKQDTVLQDLAQPIKIYYSSKSYTPFVEHANLHHQNVLERLRTLVVDKMAGRGLGACVIIIFDRIIAVAVAKTNVVSPNNNYYAEMFIMKYEPENFYDVFNNTMQISEGTINVKGDVGVIEIPNVKAQNYNSEGKATKTLTGKITIKKADGSDTTFTLSTNYTVKQLVN